ncbi:YoaK family protein [Lacisediminimonas sp.]|uniref:YoaK family protein n=1 Tax=Lacisediminimonas sp. TaxID=3060582 RepID=UPI00271E511F|nr:YoaK family protein [Lacisediminimonas sp.]MDO8301419.1 YoaK family protein [Lacisediminimonas sp.]
MPINYLARLTARERTASANLHLGVLLAFVAGALNAGGFLAIGQYTSHMTGIVSAAADNLILGNIGLAVAAGLSLFSFMAGAATTAWLVNYAQRHSATNIYAAPLRIEAALLLAFGIVGSSLRLHEIVSISLTAILLCFTMGLQNALVTKISNAEIRTTHITGLVTDIGIEIGKLIYWNRSHDVSSHTVLANRTRLRVHGAMVLSFFVGGLIGAFGFKLAGFSFTILLALPLVAMSLASALQSAGQAEDI